MEAPKIIIYGCGGHSRSVADILLATTPNIDILFVDDNAKDGELLLGFKVVKAAPQGTYKCFVGVGDNLTRKTLFETLNNADVVSIVSRLAHIGHGSQVLPGCFVGNFCHIGPEASIGTNTIINNGAIVEHEVSVGSHSHIGPNATISGRCKIGDLVFVGVGATIKDYVNVCSNVIIGAGATVVKNITEPGTYIGTPARKKL